MAKKSALPVDKSAEVTPEPKKRGAKKVMAENIPAVEEVTEQAVAQPTLVKKRGRPKKEVITEEIIEQTEIAPKSQPKQPKSDSIEEAAAEQSIGDKISETYTAPLSNDKLSDTELPEEFAFLDKTDYVQLHLEKGTLLYSAGDIAERAFFVKKGKILIITPGTDGQILWEIKSGEVCIFSAMAVLSESYNRYAAILDATSDILAVPAESFRALLTCSAIARVFVFENVMEQMSTSLRLVEEISLRRSDVRLAKVISRYVTVENTICSRSISEVAEDAMLSPETTELLLKEFQRRGYLAVNNKNIIVTDRAALIRKSLE